MRINLNYDWKYSENWSEDFIAPEFNDSNLATVQIPHTNKEVPYNYFDENMYQFVSGYRKTFEVPAELTGKTLVLKFEAVANYAVVYVNGKEAMSHKGGYTSFEADVTELLKIGEKNVITVMCDSTEREEIPPFGNVVDYLTYGGIYREVYLYVYEPDYIKQTLVSPMNVLTNSPYAEAKITISKPSDKDLKVEIIDNDGKVVSSQEVKCDTAKDNTVIIKLPVDKAELKLWDIESPNLYTCRVTYAGQEFDYKFGFREAKFTRNGFFLNGKNVKIRGLNRHQSFPYVGYAMPKNAQIADADYLKKELGVNLARTSHYPNSHHFLNRCDELGLMVFTEVPSWQYIGKTEEWRANFVESVREMILQDYNHPSIIIWGVRVNESDDDHELYTETNRVAHELDVTRMTGGVRCTPQSELLEDVYTFNDFTHSGDNIPLMPKFIVTNPKNPLLVTEHNGHMYPTKTFDDEKHRQNHAIRHANVLNEAYRRDNTCGAIGWCMSDYNTHKDFGSGDKICYHGVSDMFRMDKLAAYVYRAQQDEYPVLELTSNMEIGDIAGGRVGSVYIFTNCDTIKLYKNGEHINTFDVKELAENSEWEFLPHPPIELYDIIGNQLEKSGKFDTKDCEAIKRFLLDIKKYAHVKSIIMHLPTVLKLLVKYKQKISDVTNLYGSYVIGWGAKACSYSLEGIKGDKTLTINKESVMERKLKVEAERNTLIEDETYDTCRVAVRAVSQAGANLPYCDEVVNVSTTGPIKVIGDTTFTLPGGQRAFWIKSIGESGKATVTVTTKFATETLEFNVEKIAL